MARSAWDVLTGVYPPSPRTQRLALHLAHVREQLAAHAQVCKYPGPCLTEQDLRQREEALVLHMLAA